MYASVQGSYKDFEIALFEKGKCLGLIKGDRVQASSRFLIFFQELLDRFGKSLEDVDFIAVNQGPGAFTSLRVIISSLNAIAFNSRVSLIGVDGIDALAVETFKKEKTSGKRIVSLLNAYNNEVFYGVYSSNGSVELISDKGYKNIKMLLEHLSDNFYDKPIIFTGNGSILHKDLIIETIGECEFAGIETCSAKTVGEIGFSSFESGAKGEKYLKPLYLKKQTFAIK